MKGTRNGSGLLVGFDGLWRIEVRGGRDRTVWKAF